MVLRDQIRLNQVITAAAQEKSTIAIDFDAVIHNYNGDTSRMGPPIEGALAGIKALISNGAKIVIFSVRPSSQIVGWLKKNNFPAVPVTNKKPIAKVYLDDRGVTFKGKWTKQLLNQLLSFTPYWEKPGIDADNDVSIYHGIHVIPTYHPPSLKNPQKVNDDTSTTGWHKKDAKNKKKMARKDMQEIVKRTRRQVGKPEVSHTAIYPMFPSMYQWY